MCCLNFFKGLADPKWWTVKLSLFAAFKYSSFKLLSTIKMRNFLDKTAPTMSKNDTHLRMYELRMHNKSLQYYNYVSQ